MQKAVKNNLPHFEIPQQFYNYNHIASMVFQKEFEFRKFATDIEDFCQKHKT